MADLPLTLEEREQRISVLVHRLSDTEAELQTLLAGEADAVLDPRTATPLLLRGAQQALRESETRYRLLADVLPQQVWTARPDGALDYVNRVALDYFGRVREEIIGQWWQPVIHADDLASALERWTCAVRTGGSYEVEFRLRRADGEYRWHIGRALPLRDSAGQIVNWFGTNTDIEDRKTVEDLEQARQVAEEANRSKSQFLANMSHELRTPLNAIGGYAELIELGIRGPVTEPQIEDLGKIKRAQHHLLGLINDVLNFAKLEAGRVEFDIADIPVEATLADVEVLIAPQAHAKGIRYHRRAGDPLVAVRADRDKLQQIVLNLLSNAVKFTDRGGEISVGWEARDDAVHIHVRDTGHGIPPDKLDSVFEPFVQVNADLTRTRQGTGLGLAISWELARSMGGDLTAQSTLGEGSTFTLRLPTH